VPGVGPYRGAELTGPNPGALGYRSTMSRVALVTGAGSGIGRATAIRLSQAGLRVALAARSADALAATAQACPGPTLAVPADVTDPSAVDRLFGRAEDDWGVVDVLVASAGAGFSARIERTSDADWNRMLELNLTAPFRCLRRAVPAMRAAGYGRIVVIASTASRIGEPYLAAYTAAKHGVLGLVRAVSAELAGTGVTVNAVCPGFVDTPMTDATIGNIAQKTGRSAGQARSALEARQPIGRLIMPEEVADAVWFCVASEAITGQAINVDGGTVQS
jgi:NAD(P)-dependent dehydrogenase (short-subunit alcohol dehydrogenase family)